MMPGALGTGGSDFSEQIPFFARHYTVIAMDPAGYGQSRPPQRDFQRNFYEGDAEHAHALMSTLGFAKYSVMGWSDGANSATMLAARYPAEVTKLVAWGGNSYLTQMELQGFQEIRDVSQWSTRALEPMRRVYGEDLQTMWDGYIGGLERIYAQGGDIYQSQLGSVRCPALILHGAKDPLVGAEHPEVLRKGIGKAELVVFPDGKHNIHARYADDFNRCVLDFLQRAETSQTT
jgi:valacyclovir hydrolase